MVDGQVRTADVTDLRIISAMQEIPRERFVPPDKAGLAYLDFDVPVGGGRRLLKPMVLAKLIQAADIAPAIMCSMSAAPPATPRRCWPAGRLGGGAGGGYDLARRQARACRAAECHAWSTGPLAEGWAQARPMTSIVLEGATEIVPQTLCASSRTAAGWSACSAPARRQGDALLAAAARISAAGRCSMPPRPCCPASPSRRFSPSKYRASS